MRCWRCNWRAALRARIVGNRGGLKPASFAVDPIG
jgi:hypothetical protein